MVKIKVKPKYVKNEEVLIKKDRKYLPAKIKKINGDNFRVVLTDEDDIEKYGNREILVKGKDIKKYEKVGEKVKDPEKLEKRVNKNTARRIKIKKDKENKIVTPIYWVLQNNKRFPGWINKTFIKYKITSKSEKTPISEEFKPFLYQLFLRDYMQNASPYRGILLYHGLGSGKTCSAITIAENLKNEKNIVVILPASLKDNFIGDEKTGLLFCGDEEYKRNPKLINQTYSFVSSNASNTVQQLNSLGSLDNHVIIIDEVHNLVSRMVGGINGENKQGKIIYDKIMEAKNCKIIALTGTPIVNNIYEIAVLANILHGYIYITIFKIVHVSEKYGSSWNFERLEKIFEDMKEVNYFEINKVNRTIEFNLKVKPWDDDYNGLLSEISDNAKKIDINIEYLTYRQFPLFPDDPNEVGEKEFDKYFVEKGDPKGDKLKNKEILKRRLMGLISYYKSKVKNFPKIIKDVTLSVEMSGYQYQEYKKVREIEKASYKLAEIRVFSRQYCNFVFPPEITRPGIGQKILELKKNKEERNREKKNRKNRKKNEKNEKNEKNKKNKNTNKNDEKRELKKALEGVVNETQNVAKIIQAAEAEELEGEVKREELKKYQRAVDEALRKLSENKEKYLVKSKLGTYSNKMKQMLEIVEKSKGLGFVYSDFRSLEGVEVFSRILDANGYARFGTDNKLPKYALYTGSEDFTERTKMLKVFNSPENKYGKNIKLILATSAGAEGLDLKNVRFVIITEPYWNNVRIQQVIGRAVRRNSHVDLPVDERNVSVYRMLSVISPADQVGLRPKDQLSTDQVILDIAIRKEVITKEMLELMKEISVDCVLNALDNNGDITCFTFGEKAEGVAYTQRIGKDLGMGVGSEMREVEETLRHGAIDENNIVYFIENKKLYKVTDRLKRSPIAKIPKIKKKVAVDLDKREVYDHDAAIRSKIKVLLGKFNDKGEFYSV